VTFSYNDIEYPIEIIKKRNKNTYLRVTSDLTLQITTNMFTNGKDISKMIENNRVSIEKMFQKQLQKKKNNDGFFYLGKKYDVVYIQENKIELGQNKVFVGKNIDVSKWYKKEAKKIFQEHLDVCYNNFTRKIPYPKLRIRQMTTRWGVCNYKDIVVTLNLELMKRDTECLDYVIYHELSHLIEANHSAKFWQIVEENCPNYKNIKRRMKNY